jgi:hypothetical protein
VYNNDHRLIKRIVYKDSTYTIIITLLNNRHISIEHHRNNVISYDMMVDYIYKKKIIRDKV